MLYEYNLLFINNKILIQTRFYMSLRGESVFKFRIFEVRQDRCAMKVGTDGVLLGAWTPINEDKTVLDIGTGTGLIALMLAQRSASFIDAIEIDDAAYNQAKENFICSPWGDRIRPFHLPLQNFSLNAKKYDLIVSNPPYFINAHKSESDARNMARHTNETLTFEELINSVSLLLKPGGRFCAILPIMEGGIFIDMCERKNFFCNRITRVKTKADKPVKRMLLELSMVKEEKTLSDELIILKEDGSYTEHYIDLTKDFYTHYPDKGTW